MITNIPIARGRRSAQRGRSDLAEAARLNPWLRWRVETPAPSVLTVAELAECVCPDLCNRDHDNE
jgi:hypothetical protein